MSAPIPLIGPDGGQYEAVDEAALKNALALGYRIETPEEPQTLAETATSAVGAVKDVAGAALLGLGKGFTAGLMGGTNDTQGEFESPEDWLARSKALQGAEQHPIAGGVGEFAGMVVSPLNKVAKPIEGAIGATTALGRIGAKAVGGSAVGSLFGAGNAVNEAALGDHQLTAESLISGAGFGALLGAGGGGIGGAVDEAASKLLPKLGKAIGGAQENLSEFADNRWLKAGGAIQKDLNAIPEVEHAGVADALRTHLGPGGDLEAARASLNAEREIAAKSAMQSVGVGDAGGLLPSMSRDEAMAALERGVEDNGAKVGAILKKADAMGLRPEAGAFTDRFNAFWEGLNPAEQDLIRADMEKAHKYIQQIGSSPTKNTFGALNSIKSTLQKDTNWTADGAAKFGLKRQLVGIIRDEIDTQLAPQIGADLSKEFLEAKAAYGALSNAEKALGKAKATGADAIAALMKDAGQPAERLAALNHADRLLGYGMARNMGNRALSPSDYLTGMAVGAGHIAAGNPLGALKGVAVAVGHKILREHGAAVVASLADKIAASPALSAIAASFAKNVVKAPQLGQYLAPLALTVGFDDPPHQLAQHMVAAQADPHYAEMAQMAGFRPEVDDEHGASLAKAHSVASVAATALEHDKAIDRHIDAVFRGAKAPKAAAVMNSQDFGSKRMRQDSLAAYDKRVKEIRELAADPQALLDRTTANLGELSNVAPSVAAQMVATADRAVKYLADQAKEPLKAGPLATEWVASEADRFAFAEKLEVVQDPQKLLRDMAAGTATSEQFEAVQAVYPTLARTIADKALERMAADPKGVPYKARLMLSLLTGVDVDGSMSGPAIARNQAAIHAIPEKPPQDEAQATGARSSMTLAQRSALPNQQREMEREA